MNVGIIGTGSIAGKMAGTINQMKNVCLTAVASRSTEKAEAFANKYDIPNFFGNYKELAECENIDLIYIATPHSRHYEDCMLCLENNNNVLCEKAFTANANQAEEVINYAKRKNLFVSEAMWTRFMPLRFKLQEIVSGNTIGNISSLTANLGYSIADKERIKRPELAGGALLDLGVYVINFAVMLFGKNITDMKSTCIKNEYGMDIHNSMILTFDNDKCAVLHSNASSNTDRNGIIYGDKGRIEVQNINNYESINVILNDGTITEYKAPEQISGYEYEVEAALKAISNSNIECKEIPHDDTLYVMKIMDELRHQWEIKYPFE